MKICNCNSTSIYFQVSLIQTASIYSRLQEYKWVLGQPKAEKSKAFSFEQGCAITALHYQSDKTGQVHGFKRACSIKFCDL